MKSSSVRFGLARSLVALAVSLALVLSTFTLAFASPGKAAAKSGNRANATAIQADAAQSELQLTSVSATATPTGVLLQWRTNSTPDNVGFNVYRVKDGQRTQVNSRIIPGALFAPGTPAMMRAGYSYSWFDRSGTADSIYFIESVSVEGGKTHAPIVPVVGKLPATFEQAPSGGAANANENTDTFQKQFPAAESFINSPATLQDQWAIAAQTALKIAIKKDGWYRVTQPQMVAAGFNPTVDIRNLRLFVEGNEVAILTNQLTGPFGSGDYIEFYGRALDIPTTDVRTYYLIAGVTPGKRVIGDIQLDEPPIDPPPPVDPPPTSTPPPGSTPPTTPPVTPPVVPPVSAATMPGSTTTSTPVLRDPIFFSNVQANISWLMSVNPKSENRAPGNTESGSSAAIVHSPTFELPGRDEPLEARHSPEPKIEQKAEAIGSERNSTESAIVAPAPTIKSASKTETRSRSLRTTSGANNTRTGAVVTRSTGKARKTAGSRSKARRKLRRQLRPEHSHALAVGGNAATNFSQTVEFRQRFLYFSSLLNGDEGNYFGTGVSSTPVNQTLTVQNFDPAAVGAATLEVALQGIANNALDSHQVVVAFNGVTLGTLNFGPLDHPVQSYSIPVAQLLSGANTVRFTKTTATGDLSLIDYARITFSHLYKADAGSLRFNLRGNQTRTVDGFASPSVRLIDYTDPLNVSVTRPASEPSGSGYAITVPVSAAFSKDQRLFYAIPGGQFDQPAALSLNQPSNLNSNANAGYFLIVAYKDFIPGVEPLRAARASQFGSAKIVDIEDVYDEFGYGVHGPEALRSFLQHAAGNWATPPHYVVFAGDASYDPRNYENRGFWDLVPTKLVDATFSETASDDWLTDFDDDGVADIPVGRLPLRNVADANLVVSKILNFTPVVPQSALLVADQDEFNIFGFVDTNDTFQSLLPPGMSVQRVNRAPQPAGVPTEPDDAHVKTAIRDGFNQGRAIVSYSGHGNVDVWTNAALFSSTDAFASTNGTKLSFVVVMDCLNGFFQDPTLLSLSEAVVKAPNGGGVAAFASSGLTFAQGQHEMGRELYTQLYGGAPVALGDAIKAAKTQTFDIDVKRTWILFGDPSLKIR